MQSIIHVCWAVEGLPLNLILREAGPQLERTTVATLDYGEIWLIIYKQVSSCPISIVRIKGDASYHVSPLH